MITLIKLSKTKVKLRVFIYFKPAVVNTITLNVWNQTAACTTLYRVVQKRHKVYGTIILQPYITESCGFQQNVPKKFFTWIKSLF